MMRTLLYSALAGVAVAIVVWLMGRLMVFGPGVLLLWPFAFFLMAPSAHLPGIYQFLLLAAAVALNGVLYAGGGLVVWSVVRLLAWLRSA